MRLLFVLCFFWLTFNASAKISLPSSCENYTDVAKSSLVIFSKKELIELGECTGVALLKRRGLSTLTQACNEVIEDRLNPLGIMSLSKAEAIQIGQCVGVINYVYQRYHDERVSRSYYGSRSNVYQCLKGRRAVDVLSNQPQSRYSRNEVRDLLCDVY